MDPLRYTTRDLVLIALFAAGGVAVKPLIIPIVRVATAPFGLPTGTVAGGLFMMWLVMGRVFTGKPWAATLVGVVQVGLAWVSGTLWHPGAAMIGLYAAPGVAVDLVLWRYTGGRLPLSAGLLAGAAANATGVGLMSWIYYRLPPFAWMASTVGGAVSGAGGGLLAWAVARRIFGIIRQSRDE
ncbi:MAG: hypothetical protein VB144_01735 [Clostridia bacterium]|nr:hypothetical protein [Clostridia bacterium]